MAEHRHFRAGRVLPDLSLDFEANVGLRTEDLRASFSGEAARTEKDKAEESLQTTSEGKAKGLAGPTGSCWLACIPKQSI